MEYEGLQQQEQSDHADAERYRQEAEEGEAKVAALHEASLEAFRVGDMQRGQSLNEEAVKWVLLCLPHGCYSAFHMGTTLPFTWVLLCLSRGCYSACHMGATLPATWVPLSLPSACICAKPQTLGLAMMHAYVLSPRAGNDACIRAKPSGWR